MPSCIALVPVVRVVVYRIDIVLIMLVMRICDDAHKYFGDTFYVTVSVRDPVDTPGQMNPLKMRYVSFVRIMRGYIKTHHF